MPLLLSNRVNHFHSLLISQEPVHCVSVNIRHAKPVPTLGWVGIRPLCNTNPLAVETVETYD
jgi:hypothetical protein